MTTDLPAPTSERPQPGQLTFSAPRRGKPPRHLADLVAGRAQGGRRGAGAQGLPRQAAVDALLRAAGRVDPSEMTDLPKAIRDELVAALLPTLLTALVAAHGRRRHDDQDAWQLFDGAIVESVLMRYPQPRHHLHLEPGRLRHELPVLRDRPGRADPQHVDRRDRRAGRARRAAAAQRRARQGRGRLDRSPRVPSSATRTAARTMRAAPPGAGPTRISNVVFMGMGEALANYKAAIGAIRRLTDPAPDGPGHVGPRHHDVDRRAGAGDRQARRRGHPGHARAVACTRRTTSCATSWSRSTRAGASTRRSTPRTATSR